MSEAQFKNNTGQVSDNSMSLRSRVGHSSNVEYKNDNSSLEMHLFTAGKNVTHKEKHSVACYEALWYEKSI
jgi:hypothetical protein